MASDAEKVAKIADTIQRESRLAIALHASGNLAEFRASLAKVKAAVKRSNRLGLQSVLDVELKRRGYSGHVDRETLKSQDASQAPAKTPSAEPSEQPVSGA